MATAALGAALRQFQTLFGSGTVAGLDDAELLARYIRSKEEAAFEGLVARHGPMVLATCRAVLKREQDVEDAFQATFLVLARKAGSIRGGKALGPWLHRVAYRVAVEASVLDRERKAQEAEILAMANPGGTRPGSGFDPDLRPILHDEIDRLPHGQRLPVVLCDLEGLTYEEAANRLRWSVPKLRSRLARARQRLKTRLGRHGVSESTFTGLIAALAPPSKAVVPAALMKLAVQAATRGTASAAAMALSHTLIQGMFMTKLKLLTMTLLTAVALASAGLIASAGARKNEPNAAPALEPEILDQPVVKPAEKPAGKVVEVRGVVLGPDGKPVARARVWVPYFGSEIDKNPQTESGPDGRFFMRLPLDQLVPNLEARPELIDLAAWAPGLAPGWTRAILKADAPIDQTIRLGENGPALEGRVIDLEGRPVAGAEVKIETIWHEKTGTLDSWLATTRSSGAHGIWRDLENLSLPEPEPKVVTGPDGRFKLPGVGRDQIAELMISGPTIETASTLVLGRDEPEVRTLDRSWMEPRPLVIHAPKFQHVAAPTRPVEGVIRDKDSGQPLAGVKLHAAAYDEDSLIPAPGIEATSDAQGRYRITGLPRSPAYRLFLSPAKGTPYLNATLKVEASGPAVAPVTHEIKLKRGILVRGRVVEKGTNKPARIEYVSAHTFSDNLAYKDYPGYDSGESRVSNAAADGTFELVTLPGRGIITARLDDTAYLEARGYESIKGYDKTTMGFDTHPDHLGTDFHAYAEVNLDPKVEAPTIELTADPGRSLKVAVVGPDGQPRGGTKVLGLGVHFQTVPHDSETAEFEVHALDPARPRRIVVRHEGRKLIGSVFLRGDEVSTPTVKLVPWGELTGRIVDDEGRPRAGIRVVNDDSVRTRTTEDADVLNGADWNGGLIVDGDGRFRVEALVPGLKYSATASDQTHMQGGSLFRDVVVASGQTRDLGDLKVAPVKREGESQ